MKNNTKESWMYKYSLAKVYFEHHGNLEIPYHYKTLNGYEYTEEGIALGIWITNQRQAYKGQGTYKITKNQIKLLEKIGMRFETRYNNEEWNRKYKLAKAYFEHHGNLEIPRNYKTLNGYEYAEEGTTLGVWIKNQRQAYKEYGTNKITENQIKLLEEIGMRFETHDNNEEWNKKYKLAKAYFEHHDGAGHGHHGRRRRPQHGAGPSVHPGPARHRARHPGGGLRHGDHADDPSGRHAVVVRQAREDGAYRPRGRFARDTPRSAEGGRVRHAHAGARAGTASHRLPRGRRMGRRGMAGAAGSCAAHPGVRLHPFVGHEQRPAARGRNELRRRTLRSRAQADDRLLPGLDGAGAAVLGTRDAGAGSHAVAARLRPGRRRDGRRRFQGVLLHLPGCRPHGHGHHALASARTRRQGGDPHVRATRGSVRPTRADPAERRRARHPRRMGRIGPVRRRHDRGGGVHGGKRDPQPGKGRRLRS